MPDTPLNPDALQAAEDELWDKHIDHEGLSVGYGEAAELVVSAYLAAALPEVTSVEELEALPEGTILRDSYGLALHKRTANWWVTNCDSNLTSEDLADEIADTAHTYTVLYRPEVKP